MKDVDTCSRHINALIYRYLLHAYSMCCRDIISYPYVYSYNVFRHCYNPRHITAPTITLVDMLFSITFDPSLHYSPLCVLRSPYLFHLST